MLNFRFSVSNSERILVRRPGNRRSRKEINARAAADGMIADWTNLFQHFRYDFFFASDCHGWLWRFIGLSAGTGSAPSDRLIDLSQPGIERSELCFAHLRWRILADEVVSGRVEESLCDGDVTFERFPFCRQQGTNAMNRIAVRIDDAGKWQCSDIRSEWSGDC